VGLHCDFFDVSVHILSHIVAPEKGYHHKKQHLADAVQIREMWCFFDHKTLNTNHFCNRISKKLPAAQMLIAF